MNTQLDIEERRSMDTKEAAARIRADIKTAQKDGTLPKGLKVSVRMATFSMGSSITVEITKLPEGAEIANTAEVSAYLRAHPGNSINDFQCPELLSTEASAWLATCDNIVNTYHFSETDLQTDYHRNNFFKHVQFAGEVRNFAHLYALEAELHEIAREAKRTGAKLTPGYNVLRLVPAAPATTEQENFLTWLETPV